MDKAKKMAEQAAAQGKVLAEQAQTKIDEVQNDFNAKQTAGQAQEPAVEYDKHGRPVGQPQAPAEGAAAAAGEAPSTPPAEAAAAPAPPTEGAAPSGDPLAAPPAPPAPPTAPPAPPSSSSGMTSGDPLAG